jgi:hypothetical protein
MGVWGDFAFACGSLDSGYPPSADSGMTTRHLRMEGRAPARKAIQI